MVAAFRRCPSRAGRRASEAPARGSRASRRQKLQKCAVSTHSLAEGHWRCSAKSPLRAAQPLQLLAGGAPSRSEASPSLSRAPRWGRAQREHRLRCQTCLLSSSSTLASGCAGSDFAGIWSGSSKRHDSFHAMTQMTLFFFAKHQRNKSDVDNDDAIQELVCQQASS